MQAVDQLHVLIAEDDSNTSATIRIMLRELGFTQIYEARDGVIADEYMQQSFADLDLVISDWNMPNKNGYELLQDIRSANPALPFLMITARSDTNSVLDAKSKGVSGYLRKPFTLDELQDKVFSALGI